MAWNENERRGGGKEGERLNPFNIRKWVVSC